MFTRNDIKDIYPLSPMQKGMLFHYIKDRHSRAYFEQATLQVEGVVDIKLFEQSFNKLIEKHDALRTIFTYEKTKEPKQIVLKHREGKVYFEDMSHLSDSEKMQYVEEFKEKDLQAGFNLKIDIPMRISILKFSDEKYVIVWSHHHIIMDGWCLGLLMQDFFSSYQLLKNGQVVELVKPKSYSSFIKWLSKQDESRGINYWREYLEGYEKKAVIPETVRTRGEEYVLRKVFHTIDPDLTAKLTKLAQDKQVTLNTLFQVVWGILLHKYNMVEDVVFGAVVSGRPSDIPGIEMMVGLFINNIPVRIKYNQGDSFGDLAQKVQKEGVISEQYNYLSLADIQATTEIKHDLIDHILVFENYPLDVQDQIDQLISRDQVGFTVTDVQGVDQTTYNFGVIIIPGEELIVELKYNACVCNKQMIERIGGHLVQIMEQVIENPDQDLLKIDILTDVERKLILQEFNQTETQVSTVTIHQLFEEQVAKTPDCLAVTYNEQSLTYRELNGRANQLARHLRSKGVQADQIVGLMVKPSLEMVVGIMAVLKAGGAYLPIDPEYPVERIKFLLEDSQSQILLTHGDLLEKVDFAGGILDLADPAIYKGEDTNLASISLANHLVYVIYTSGTTGKPKGVLLKHQNLVNYVSWFTSKVDLNTEDRGLLTSSFAFDLGYTSLYPTILNGCQLHLIDKETYLSGKKLLDYIQKNQITYLKATPSLFKIIMNSPNFSEANCQSLRLLLLGGEEINLQDVEKAYATCQNLQIMNHYGPTEATIGCIAQFIDRDQFAEYKLNPTIGQPIDNTQVFILDQHQKLLPLGIPGEICIGGEGLARCYLNREELTAERFIERELQPGSVVRLYRTGDCGRYLEDGRIEFLGRIDQQVKIRGYRVEPEEIANHIIRYDLVKEAVVIAKEDKDQTKYLCAYMVCTEEFDLTELKEFLRGELPNYMIPSYFVELQHMPLTPNGKIDRKALPEPDGTIDTGVRYAAPRNEVEEGLVEIWEELLGIKRIGIYDNFFEMGGHSLKATVLISRVHKELNVEIPLVEIFNSPTIAGLYDYINRAEKNVYASISPIPEQEYYPISSAQKRLLIINQKEGADISYNMVGAMTVEGNLNLERFEGAFQTLIERHETLRTSFHLINGEYVQKVHDSVDFKIVFVERPEWELEETIQQFIRPFDLSQAPLLRVGLVKEAEERYILLFDMHHIISDGTAMGILIREFIQLYEGYDLKDLQIQYKDFTAWQNQFFEPELIKEQEQYWLAQFVGEIPVLALPTDNPRPARQSFEGKRINFTLDIELTKALKEITLGTGTTLYMVLLAAYNVLLHKYTGHEDIIVGSPIAGRPHVDLENIIGMFINTLPMRNQPKGDQTFKEFLTEVKRNALKAYKNQDYQFERLVDQLNLKRDFSRNPLFDVAFTLQNMERTQIELDNLKFESYEFENNIAKFDLLMIGTETADQIEFVIEYLFKLFNQPTVEKMRDHYIEILTQIAEDVDRKLADIQISYELATASTAQIDDGDFGF